MIRKRILPLLIAAVMLVILTACGGVKAEELTGTWSTVMNNGATDTITFNSDMTFKRVIGVANDVVGLSTTLEGTYSVKGKTLKMNIIGSGTQDYVVYFEGEYLMLETDTSIFEYGKQ